MGRTVFSIDRDGFWRAKGLLTCFLLALMYVPVVVLLRELTHELADCCVCSVCVCMHINEEQWGTHFVPIRGMRIPAGPCFSDGGGGAAILRHVSCHAIGKGSEGLESHHICTYMCVVYMYIPILPSC